MSYYLSSNRRGESESRVPLRSPRVFTIKQDWFFSTREGVNHGPYKDKPAAEIALKYMKLTQRWAWE